MEIVTDVTTQKVTKHTGSMNAFHTQYRFLKETIEHVYDPIYRNDTMKEKCHTKFITKSYRNAISIHLAHKYMTAHFPVSWLGAGTSIKSGGVRLVLWTQNFPLSKMMRTCTCFPRVSKMYANL